MRPRPLPDRLPAGFSVSEARELGVTVGRLRASDLRHPFHGTRARTELGIAEQAQLALSVLPDHAFICGPTAAELWGIPLPRHLEYTGRESIDIGVPAAHTRIRRAGVHARRLILDDSDVQLQSRLRILSPPRVWIDISERLRPADLVAATDYLIARRRPLASQEELQDAHRRFAAGRGSRSRAVALDVCDPGAESPRESILRFLLVQAGLPRPECNVNICDGARFVGRVDLLYRHARLIIEYDGDYHRDPRQWSKDQSRRAELESLGYRVTVVTRTDIEHPDILIARIRRLLAA